MRILVSGGGTAGHISPILATVDALKSLEPDLDVLYVGQAGGMEERLAKSVGLKFAQIKAGKFRRSTGAGWTYYLKNWLLIFQNIRDLGRVIIGLGQSLVILRQFKPEIVFIKGGYVGLPVGLAAGLLRIPYVVHESDIHPGLTNRILSKRAKQIAVGFPKNYYRDWPAEKMTYTGNPIRAEFLKYHRLEGLAYFKLEDSLPVVLVMGGSQGARAINHATMAALPELLKFCQVVHLTGEGEFESVKFELGKLNLPQELSRRYVFRAFLMHDIGMAYAASDIVVSRAGAGTIAEIAALAKPAIIIPNYLMAGHQVENAKMLGRAGAARVIQEARLQPAMLTSQIKQLVESPDIQADLSQKIKQFGYIDGAKRLAKTILDSAETGEAE